MDTSKFEKMSTNEKFLALFEEIRLSNTESRTIKGELRRTYDEVKKTNEEVKRTNDEVKRSSDAIKQISQKMKALEDNVGTIAAGMETTGQRVEAVEKRVDRVEAKCEVQSEAVSSAILMVEKNLQEYLSFQDWDDIESRKTNLCIFGLKEANASLSPKERQKHDADLFGEIVKVVSPGAIGRIGNRLGSIGEKPRPLIAMMNTEEMRDNVLRGLKNLKGLEQWSGVSIAMDRTRKQRQNDENRYKDLKIQRDEKNEKMSPEEKNEYVWVIWGRTGNRHLRRVRKN